MRNEVEDEDEDGGWRMEERGMRTEERGMRNEVEDED